MNKPCRGIIHVGAHDLEERQLYADMTDGKVLWIEANPTIYQRNIGRVDGNKEVLVHALITDVDGVDTDFRITSFDMSSSIFKLAHHLVVYPWCTEVDKITLKSSTLKSIVDLHGGPQQFDYLHLDIQGAELLAMKGYEPYLQHLKTIRTEVNNLQLYDGAALIGEVDEYLGVHGFTRTDVQWWENRPDTVGWGDATYTRNV
jgi:FkbM family methyltransferase